MLKTKSKSQGCKGQTKRLTDMQLESKIKRENDRKYDIIKYYKQ